MANEWQSTRKEHRDERDLDARLTDFYGPPLPEQPLPAEAWLRMRSQLSPRHRFLGRWLRQRLRRRGNNYSDQDSVPSFIQHAFSTITYEASLPEAAYASGILQCSFKASVRIPQVRVYPLRRHKIKLTLLPQQERSLEPPELDVLLATGLARLLTMRNTTYRLKCFLMRITAPLALVALILLRLHGLSTPIFLIAIVIYVLTIVGAIWSWHILRRNVAHSADSLAVQWLGRSRVCQGLHMLVGRDNATAHWSWGEPSLSERIARVCGTQVTVEDEQLTLVR